MASRNLDRAIQRFVRVAEPPDRLQLLEAASGVIDPTTRRLTSPAIADTRQPEKISWKPADTGGDAAMRAGTAVLIRAYATTAPSTGDAVITITKVTEFSGSEALPVLTIPNGSNFGDEVISVPVEAGAWFVRTVTTANGASGISVQLVIQPRS